MFHRQLPPLSGFLTMGSGDIEVVVMQSKASTLKHIKHKHNREHIDKTKHAIATKIQRVLVSNLSTVALVDTSNFVSIFQIDQLCGSIISICTQMLLSLVDSLSCWMISPSFGKICDGCPFCVLIWHGMTQLLVQVDDVHKTTITTLGKMLLCKLHTEPISLQKTQDLCFI